MRGFHLRVRWPKWTPVSSRAFILMTDMRATSVAFGLRLRPPRPEPRFRGTPDPVGRRVGYPLAGGSPREGQNDSRQAANAGGSGHRVYHVRESEYPWPWHVFPRVYEARSLSIPPGTCAQGAPSFGGLHRPKGRSQARLPGRVRLRVGLAKPCGI